MALLKSLHGSIVGSLVVLALLTFASSPTAAGTVRVGDGLPTVTLSDWQGDPLELTAQRANVTIIDFWASWCEPCRALLPELNAIGERYARGGLRVIAVNIDKARTPADAFLRTCVPAPAMTLARDPGGGVLARYGASGMPALYVVDQSGVVRLVESGFTVEKIRTVEALVGKLLDRTDTP